MKNKDIKKRILAIILCLVMVAGICGTALAEGLDAGGTVDVETENGLEPESPESLCEVCDTESCTCEIVEMCDVCMTDPCTCEVVEDISVAMKEEKQEVKTELEVESKLALLPEGATVPDDCSELYIYSDVEGTYEVIVYAPEGALPEDAVLVAELLDEDCEAYLEADKLASEEKTYDGMIALDVRFELNGEEIEPSKPVYVHMNLVGLIPENADPDSLATIHFKEETDVISTEIVADAKADTGTLEATENKAADAVDVNVAFALDSFSTLGTTYSTNGTVTRVTDIASLNANVQLFNYTFDVNLDANRIKYNYVYNGQVLREGKFAFESGVQAKDNIYTGSYYPNGYYDDISMNGWDLKGSYAPGYESEFGALVRPGKTLVNGYPTIGGVVENSPLGGTCSLQFSETSMEYLFSDTYKASAVMDNGGGLFQLTDDGYYEFDSAKNSAYYDSSSKKFLVYDTPISAHYINNFDSDIASDGTANDHKQFGMFLPFNDPNDIGSEYNTRNGVDYYKLKSDDEYWPDMWFGMTVDFSFYMPEDGQWNGKDMVFEFDGDDDVLVFIDDVLVLDISGIHSPENSSVNFATGEVNDLQTRYQSGKSTTIKQRFIEAGYTDAQIDELFDGDTFKDYSAHTLKFFYLERGSVVSYCHLKFNIPTLPDGALTVAKNVKSETTVANKKFEFEIELKDKQGNALDTVDFIDQDGATGTLSLTNGIGTFWLADDEAYTFDLPLNCQYAVEEIDANKNNYATTWVGETTGTINNSTPIYILCENTSLLGDVVTDKTISGTNQNNMMLSLEAFVTGKTVHIPQTTPTDIVLVLDYSHSMLDEFDGTEYSSRYNDTLSKGTAKISTLIDATQSFIDAVSEHAVTNNYDHRVGIIAFGDYSTVKHSLVSVNGNEDSLKNSVEINSYAQMLGATNISKGLSDANNMLVSAEDGEERNKIVVVFTDGYPGNSNANTWTAIENKEANTALPIAKSIKNTYGATVYTIGVIDDADPLVDISSGNSVNRFLHYLSSNYPQAASMEDGGTGSNTGHYYVADDAVGLKKIFEDISTTVVGTSVSLDANSILRDTLTKEFKLDTSRDISVYTADCIGKSGSTYLFSDQLTDITSSVSVTTSKDGNLDVIELTNYDYGAAENLVSVADGPKGKKVILKIPILASDSNMGGEKQATNKHAEIEAKGEIMATFPDPFADVPTKVTVRKEVVGDYTEEDFPFTVTYYPFDRYEETPLAGDNESNLLDAFSTSSPVSSTKDLANGDEWLVDDIMFGSSITVKETPSKYYTTTVTVSYVDENGDTVTNNLQPDENGAISVTVVPGMEITYTNTFITESIQITKVGTGTGAVLKGAQFKLEADGSNKYFNSLYSTGEVIGTSDDNGVLTFDVPYGTYTLTEVVAPAGYMLLEEPFTIEVSESGIAYWVGDEKGSDADKIVLEKDETLGMYTWTISNSLLYELPSTGSHGIYLYLIAGVVLLMGGSTILYKNRCKEVLRRR